MGAARTEEGKWRRAARERSRQAEYLPLHLARAHLGFRSHRRLGLRRRDAGRGSQRVEAGEEP